MAGEIQKQQAGIVSPMQALHIPKIGSVAVMAASRDDLKSLRDLMGLGRSELRRMFISKLYVGNDEQAGKCSLIGPLIGAPYAVMILEMLIACGVQKIIFFGWCGAVSHRIKIGDIIIPDAAIIDEGTSRHYAANSDLMATPSSGLFKKAKHFLQQESVKYHQGIIWTTDAVYRETPEKIKYYQQKKVLAVEMESSALFTVGRYRQVDVISLLVVSDEVSALSWRQGFRDNEFIESRKNITGVIGRLCHSL